MNFFESIHLLNSLYWNDDVWRILIQFMGGICDSFHLEKGLRKLSNSENLWKAMNQTACNHLAVAGRQICELKRKLQTGRSVNKDEYLSHYVNYEHPPLELAQSMWQQNLSDDINSPPKRVLFYFDIEYYNNIDSTIALFDQQKIFGMVEPIYWLIKETLLEFGINHIVTSAGRGYHFVSSVPAKSPVYQKVLEIGAPIEPSLAAKQKYPLSKRRKPVTWQAEKSFHGMLRLVLFLAGLIIQQARKRSRIPVEMTDRGTEGISFDLSMLTRSVCTSTFTCPASPYLKLHFQKNLNPVVIHHTPIPVRLIRARNQHENFPDFKKMIEVRNDYRQVFDHFAGQIGYIPDGSIGLNNLITLYWKSPMARFHQLMDNEEHNHYWDWWKSYRNYDGICYQFPHLAKIIRNPNPALLQPDNLNRLINDFMDAGWNPKHIGGFIRAIYEDWPFNWGNRFVKYDAAKWANGWVEILGSQRYFGT